jgi:hypothetical protein
MAPLNRKFSGLWSRDPGFDAKEAVDFSQFGSLKLMLKFQWGQINFFF